MHNLNFRRLGDHTLEVSNDTNSYRMFVYSGGGAMIIGPAIRGEQFPTADARRKYAGLARKRPTGRAVNVPADSWVAWDR